MCGICGVISREPDVDEGIVRRMQAALTHRGPDGAGEFFDAHVALAMRRLSIIDLTGGWQPLYSEDRSIALVANGEVYNFVELRKSLEEKGHRFGTGSDCEAIIHLYEDYGDDCVKFLRGMYAFALWDGKKGRLLLARDRMGEKPLYLYESEGRLLFSSEIRSLLGSGQIPFRLDPSAVNLYFYYQFVPEPYTPIKGIVKLDAGHVLTVDVKAWRILKSRYWKLEDSPALQGDPAKLIRDELEAVSEIVVRSDVPVGVALSGGLDSSAVAALAAKKYPGTIHAFSVGYPGHPPNDERNDAKAFADHLDIPFHDIELTTRGMVDFFPELVYRRDDPIADISGYGYYMVMSLARKHNVPVILQGQGGDELFWGYSWVREAVRESLLKASYSSPSQVKLLDYLKPSPPDGVSPRRLYRWVKSAAGMREGLARYSGQKHTPEGRLFFYDRTPDFQDAGREMGRLYTPSFAGSLNGRGPYDLFTFPRPWPRVDVLITGLICNTYLLENGIAQGDRLSMASSIELRLPLLDYRLVETVVGLRKTAPDHMLPPKTLLKAALKDVLPDWVVNRPKKGFAPPTGEWFESLFSTYGQSLKDGYLVRSGVLKAAGAGRLAEGRYRPEAIMPIPFKALVLETWCRQLIENIGLDAV